MGDTRTSDAAPGAGSAPAVIGAVRRWAEETPETVAVTAGETSTTYGELWRTASVLAERLAALDAGPDRLVATYLPRGTSLVTAVIGVLASRAAYLPLSIDWPMQRVRYVLANAAPIAVVGQDGADVASFGLPTVALDNIPPTQDGRAPVVDVRPSNLVYVVYTSGSTGEPKGVMVTHGGLENFMSWTATAYPMQPGERTLMIADPAFDASAWEIFAALWNGATLVVAPDDVRTDVWALARFVEENDLAPSLIVTAIAERLVRDAQVRRSPRVLLTGGDRMRNLGEPYDGRPPIMNHYGATECTIASTAGEIGDGELHVGSPIQATGVHVLDPRLAPVDAEATGRIYLSGAGVSRGYIGAPGLTASKFVPNSFGPPGSRMYDTGDYGWLGNDGILRFVGRRDNQVSLRGWRIELGEIEHTAMTLDGVAEACAVVVATPTGETLGLAVGVGGAEVVPRDVRRHLVDRLPSYMVPSSILALDSLPVTPRAKVDRVAVAAMLESDLSDADVVPRTPTEELVAMLWCEVLGCRVVGVDDNFFELGGHSILATELVAKVSEEFQVDLALNDFFDGPTVAELAEVIDALRRPDDTR